MPLLDSNQPALMMAMLNVGRLGTYRLGAPIDPRNRTSTGANAWVRHRAINPAHNATPGTDVWTVVKGV